MAPVLLTSAWLLPFIALAIHWKGFKWTRNLLQKWSAKDTNAAPAPQYDQQQTLEKARSVARMVTIAANLGPYRANCLKKSLAAWLLLCRRGVEAKLRIGVNKDAGDFSAHAWIEVEGVQLLNDGVDEDYNETLLDKIEPLIKLVNSVSCYYYMSFAKSTIP